MKQVLFLIGGLWVTVLAQAQQPKFALSPEAAETLEEYGNGYDLTKPRVVFQLGYAEVYYGRDAIGNELMGYALSQMDSVSGDDYHEFSVQNTKNGNQVQAIAALERAVALDPQIYGYYGWVLLYYYHDYTKALECLEKYDALTANFSDAPVGEDIHLLKGLCYMKLNQPEKTIAQFDLYIAETGKSHGEDFVDPYTFVYKGRCLDKLGRVEEALVCYDKAILYYKYNTEAHYYKGLSLLQLGQKKDAVEYLNKALELARQNHFYRDVYVEFFESVYLQDIEQALREVGER